MPTKQETDHIHCPCGKTFRKSHKTKHERTTKHQEWLKNQEECVYTRIISRKDSIVKNISSSFQKIISVECLNKSGIKWGNNGVGNRLFPSHNYSVIYSNGKTRTYSDNIDDVLENNSEIVRSFISSYKKTTKKSGIIGIFIHSVKEKNGSTRPIRDDIRQKCKEQVCVICGTSTEVLPDHKNDLYNDDRVLSVKTQNKDDFQTLCSHCNLRKRQVAIQEKKSQKIYSAKNIPQFQYYNFPFPWEFHHYDALNPKCKEHSYWYDPVEFHRKLSIYMMLRPVLQSIKK